MSRPQQNFDRLGAHRRLSDWGRAFGYARGNPNAGRRLQDVARDEVALGILGLGLSKPQCHPSFKYSWEMLGGWINVDHNLSADVACQQDRGPLFPGSSCYPLSPDHKHKPLGCKSSGNNAVEFKLISVWFAMCFLWLLCVDLFIVLSPWIAIAIPRCKHQGPTTSITRTALSFYSVFCLLSKRHTWASWAVRCFTRGAENMISWIWFSISWVPRLQLAFRWTWS